MMKQMMGWEMYQALVPVLDTAIIAVGLFGHSLLMFILLRRRRKPGCGSLWGTDTLLLVLSTSDMLLLLSLPFHTAAIALGNWPFGNLLCKAVSFLGVTCNTASAFTLAALALTRYLAVVHPAWLCGSGTRRWMRVAVFLLWAPALVLASPQFAFRTVGTYEVTHCFAFLGDVGQVIYSAALFLFGFAVPLAIIVVMYAKLYGFLRGTGLQRNASQMGRYQKRVTRTTALLVVVFTVCWLPAYVVMFLQVGRGINGTSGYRSLAVLARLMATCSSVVNPLLYAFVSRKFRRELLGRAGCGGRLTCCRDTVRPFIPPGLDTPPHG